MGALSRGGPPRPAIACVLKGYPRLSETFIAQEIKGLEDHGIDLRIFSLRDPTDPAIHPIHRQIRAPVVYLPEYLHRQPRRVIAAWRKVRRWPAYRAARRLWLRDLRRDRSRNRFRRFGQALVLAAELPGDIGWLHAHFLHTPSSVTRYTAHLLQLPWSASAHAKDIWTTPDWEKRDKLADVQWLVTCTRTNAEHLAALAPAVLAPNGQRVSLVYHGLDLDRFPPPPEPRRPPRDGSEASDPIRILSVGRTVEKKGFDVLLHALARLPPHLAWHLCHIGGGPLGRDLARLARTLGLADRIDWLGPQPQDRVLAHYRAADLFVLACRIAADGDRDGLPNVLLEAQSQRLPCLATRVSAIPELIEDGATGVLVAPDDAPALATALTRLIRDPDLRHRLGAAGLHRVESVFSHQRGLQTLVSRFRQTAQSWATCTSPSTLP
ncbi:MAG: glycosyltransferase family 4 protein [Rhodospirillales bacterium]